MEPRNTLINLQQDKINLVFLPSERFFCIKILINQGSCSQWAAILHDNICIVLFGTETIPWRIWVALSAVVNKLLVRWAFCSLCYFVHESKTITVNWTGIPSKKWENLEAMFTIKYPKWQIWAYLCKLYLSVSHIRLWERWNIHSHSHTQTQK